ncbi:tyrosine-protein phosphatase 69D [Trichonephila clavipes]|nr:tyrosine-protein phosphatase 69D [Trichonephila clavipes]
MFLPPIELSVEFTLLALPCKKILAKQSEYFKPVQTSSLSSSGSSAGTAPPVRPTDSPMTFLFGVICGTILVVLVLILVICLIRRRNSCPYDGDDGEHLGLTALLRRTVHRSSHLARGSHLSKLPYFGPIAAEELPAVYAEKHLDTDLLFRSEFEALPDVFRDRTTTASDCIDNICKNRYPEIKAYDQTRIRLSSDLDIPGSDYINANFVELRVVNPGPVVVQAWTTCFRLAIDRENKQARLAMQSDGTNVAMHNAAVQQPLTTVSLNLNPTIVVLQAEAGFVSKPIVISFYFPCPFCVHRTFGGTNTSDF